ncbi:hypothetical protein BRARA_G02108 [Brassica rapa]|uniref:Apple domain-containing protein n=1 Tax=Brassica campestris TaxID=3711 RepID=A0A397YN43_BRACM|nr:hypothetical protein BRARA_G02108 [Brassica rapa]
MKFSITSALCITLSIFLIGAQAKVPVDEQFRVCNACPSDKGLLGWDETCKTPSLASCDPKTFHYFKIEGADSFMTKYNGGSSATEKACGDKCTRDCKCLGFFYNRKSSRCWLGYELKTLTRTGDSSLVAYVKAPNANKK